MTDVQPVQVGEWMRVSHPWKDMPVNNLADLKMRWQVWWVKLLPADAAGESLWKPGKNGFFLVIMSLAWWGNATGADKEWRNVVCQVVEALRSLQVAGGKLPAQDAAVIKSGKRKHQANEDTTGGRPSHQTKSVWVCCSCLAMCIDFFS
jgi:hypothetical protein